MGKFFFCEAVHTFANHTAYKEVYIYCSAQVLS